MYEVKDGEKVTALNNFTYEFPEAGMVFIKGRSGSGKSTLLNLISLIDTPTYGDVIYDGENILQYDKYQKEFFLQHKIGIVFQNYHLLENETVLFNVMLPLYVKEKRPTIEQAETALKKVNLPAALYEHKVQDLSGGEKQRVAIARALVKDPSFIIADEPTGAVDHENSHAIMDILKEESKYKLVIVVSHNPELIDEYADTIITLENGKIIDTSVVNNVTRSRKEKKQDSEMGKRTNFVSHLALSNFKHRRRQTIFNMVVMSLCMLFAILIFGFISNIDTVIYNQSALAFDYGALTIASTETEEIEGTSLSLVRSSRPDADTIQEFKKDYPQYVCDYNLDYFINGGTYSLRSELMYDISLQPIYSFEGSYVNHALATYGSVPIIDNLNEVVVNQLAFDILSEVMGMDPLRQPFNYTLSKTIYYYDENTGETIADDYVFDYNFSVVGVVDDFSFLATPKIYYTYIGLFEYLNNTLMENMTERYSTNISFYDYISTVSDRELVTSYSDRLFLRNYQNISTISLDIESLPENLSMTSLTQQRVDAFASLLEAVEVGLIFFLVIVVIVTLILLGIICLSSYLADSKQLAILMSLGVNRGKTIEMYIYENTMTTLIAIVVTFVLSLLFQMLLNSILLSATGIAGFIAIPFTSFLGVPFLFPVLIIVASLILVVVTCALPILVSGRISIKEELQNSD